MLSAFLVGVIVGAFLCWRISRWWRQSPIKKASDAVGTVTHGPAKAAKGIYRKAKDLFKAAFKAKNHKEDE